MLHTVNNEGLYRLISLELNRIAPESREEARKHLVGRMGAYDSSYMTIDTGLDRYFASR